MADINLSDLAKTLDTEDMIGFTRAFVEDFKVGLQSVNTEPVSYTHLTLPTMS